MCGIAGFWDFNAPSIDAMMEDVKVMTDSLEHRGPDAADYWTSSENGLAFGHRRLAIIDLSENGIQPMHSYDGRYTIVYNGEIYNHTELRQELEAAGCQFKGHSDTEVLISGFVIWGIEATIKRAIGMFAFAVWDGQDKTLTLGRDRLGIKPLYWSWDNQRLLFGSELKALSAHRAFRREIDLNALGSFFRHNYIPAPYCIYKKVQKLEAGFMATISPSGDITHHQYWSLDEVRQAGQNMPYDGTDEKAIDELEALLTDSVSRRMISDVPFGAFLSGGIDSSTVAALMQAHSSMPVKTFSIGFNTEGYNEAEHAKAVAAHLKTDHTELYVSGQQARDVIPLLPHIYDEPFSDSSQIPTYLVSKMTKDHVTVALSGDGGDELFAGYNRYTATDQMASKIFSVPKPIRRAGAGVLSRMPPRFWQQVSKMAPVSLKFSNPANKAAKVAAVLRGNKNDLYRTLISHWENPSELVPGSQEYLGPAWDDDLDRKIPNFVERMQYIDAMTYMPDDILTKVDRASMAVSLEARVPLIDHRVVEYAWSLPMNMKIRNGQSKWLLRQVLYRHVPAKLIDRPKMGFGIPLSDWLRGPLKDWAADLLDPVTLKNQGIINPELVEQKWQAHLAGRHDWGYHLWDVLMFQAWQQKWS